MSKYKAKRIYYTDVFGDTELDGYEYRGYTINIAWDFWNYKWYSIYELNISSMKFSEVKKMLDEYLESEGE